MQHRRPASYGDKFCVFISAGTVTGRAAFPGGDLFVGGVNKQTGTTYTVASTDEAVMVTYANAGAVAVTLPQATTAGFTAGAQFWQFNVGPGTVTITPTTSTINGQTTTTLYTGQGVFLVSDGTNYSAWVSNPNNWSNNLSPVGNLTLTMGANTSSFNTTTAVSNFFLWANSTAATSTVAQSSPILTIGGRAWHGSADTFDGMTLQYLPNGGGNDQGGTITIGHEGLDSGIIATTVPGPIQSTSDGVHAGNRT